MTHDTVLTTILLLLVLKLLQEQTELFAWLCSYVQGAAKLRQGPSVQDGATPQLVMHCLVTYGVLLCQEVW